MDAPVHSIDFALLSADDVRRQSVVEVTETALSDRNIPRDGGVNDLRMGTVQRVVCKTCRNATGTCPGHFGHIELVEPVFHPLYVDVAIKVLRCVCTWCSELLMGSATDGARERGNSRKVRLGAASASCKAVRQCPSCGGRQPDYYRIGMGVVRVFPEALEDPEEQKVADTPFSARAALRILRHVSDETCAAVGLNPRRARPESFILEVVPVPPPCIRPSMSVGDNSRSRGQDDITVKLQDCIKINAHLRELADKERASGALSTADTTQFQRYVDILSLNLCLYFDKDVRLTGASTASRLRGKHNTRLRQVNNIPRTTPCKSLTQRLKGKRGRVRGNIMGKRVNFSSRTVITPDASLDADELGIPEAIARHQTMPERVNDRNMRDMARRVRNGPDHRFGAHVVEYGDGRTVSLANMECRDGVRLEVGCVVHRNLKDGDPVVFNRQPSLHKESMMGHYARIMSGSTFRLPVMDTSPYNADFDGDEMNLHVPQSYAARAEVETIMLVRHQILSAQNNKPCIGSIQDTCVGSYLLTMDDVFLTRDEFFNFSMACRYSEVDAAAVVPAVLRPQILYTGRQLLSLAVPACVSLTKRTRDLPCDGDYRMDAARHVVVRNGQVLSGTLCKQMTGKASGGIVHYACLDGSAERCMQFLSDNQRLVATWLCSNGFSVGIKDCSIPHAGNALVDKVMARARLYLDEHVGDGALEDLSGAQEADAAALLNRAFDTAGRVVCGHVARDNAVLHMLDAGSKGSRLNMSQIMGCIGQTTVNGGRVKPCVAGGRTLPQFPAGSTDALASGWVQSSFVQGLTASEFFQHARGGREGLVDTSVKTAYTGYIQRRLAKLMEAITVAADGTVRNIHGMQVLSIRYGGDGICPKWLEKVQYADVLLSDAAVRDKYDGEADGVANAALALRDAMRDVQCKSAIHAGEGFGTAVFAPFNAQRYAENAPHGAQPPATPEERLDVRLALERHVVLVFGEIETVHMRGLLVSVFHGKTVRRLSRDALEDCAARVRRACDRARVEPGEMVGPQAATSIGEPCTQMTLNTFHTAGASKKGNIADIEQGVGQFKRLIDVSSSTASYHVALDAAIETSEDIAAQAATAMECTYLKDVLESCAIVPHGRHVDPLVQWLHELRPEPRSEQQSQQRSEPTPVEAEQGPVIRIVVDKRKAQEQGLDIVTIGRRTARSLGHSAHVAYSEVNMDEWVLRIAMVEVDAIVKQCIGEVRETDAVHEYTNTALQRAMCVIIQTTRVKGISDIRCAEADKRRVHVTQVGGGVRTLDTYGIAVSGGRMGDIYRVQGIDPLRTFSKDPAVVLEWLGVEAARRVLRWQMEQVLMADGSYINYRHLDLLTRCMTYRGLLCPVSRHGMARSDQQFPPLMRASFEETVTVFRNAAVYGETDACSGVSQSIMLGTVAPVGTGRVELVKAAPKATAGFVGRRRRRRLPENAAPQRRYWDPTVDPDALYEAVLKVPRVIPTSPRLTYRRRQQDAIPPSGTPSGTPPGTPPGTPSGTPPGTPPGTPSGTPPGTPPISATTPVLDFDMVSPRVIELQPMEPVSPLVL